MWFPQSQHCSKSSRLQALSVIQDFALVGRCSATTSRLQLFSDPGYWICLLSWEVEIKSHPKWICAPVVGQTKSKLPFVLQCLSHIFNLARPSGNWLWMSRGKLLRDRDRGRGPTVGGLKRGKLSRKLSKNSSPQGQAIQLLEKTKWQQYPNVNMNLLLSG